MGDVGLEVASECLRVAEIEPAVEVHSQFVIVDADFAVKAFALQVAVKNDFVDGGTEELGVVCRSVDVEFEVPALGLPSGNMGVNVKRADDLGRIGQKTDVEAVGLDYTLKHVLMFFVNAFVETEIDQPCDSIMLFTIERPRPVPFSRRELLPLKNGSKINGISFS